MVQNEAHKTKINRASTHGMIIIANCPNITQLVNQYMDSINKTNGTGTYMNGAASTLDDSQKDAVVYIVVVLFFYSFCIGFMMIRYMQKEAKEQQECKKYRRYINMAQDQYLQSMNRTRLANRLALQALNTVNAIPQTTNYGSKVTFV
ncbi:hypothetical protein AVEN_193731-1 [Araneus ventricosus]|uniref:Uncharacterized protein n=2 Tax=Araneus ventricosus TaxID=182803 RepID=A0A4Y2WTE9_ARAVE|nr:hypothetical protein AVEN_154303-1 [Araneus ventricosus]GBO39967.1 hypothetical protein AVEN_196062-1 [Araneus ventricosus]GBO40076.1 hypothetical protein AVEN_193731-1 [Araneus ventricosus]